MKVKRVIISMCHAITVQRKSLEDRRITGVPKGFSAIKNAIRLFAETSYREKNNTLIEEYSKMANQSGSILRGTVSLIQNGFHTSKREDMHENAMRKVPTVLRNGLNYVVNPNGGAFIVESAKNLPKTILSHSPLEGLITL